MDPQSKRIDRASTAVQNATDQVTEPVNIADARDLHRSLDAPLAFHFTLKGLALKLSGSQASQR